MYLNLDQPTRYLLGNDKRFAVGEKHVTRICRDDVLLLMLEGTLYFSENGQPVELHEGEYYIQKRDILQEGLRPCDGTYYYWFHFRGEFTDIGSPFSLPIRGTFSKEQICPAAEKLCRSERTKNHSYTWRSALFLNILSLICEGNRAEGGTSKLAEAIHAYLSEHCAEPIRISDLAGQFSYSEDYLIRVFRRHYGVTPHKYLNTCRMDLAKVLLATTDRSVSDIASMCGFSDLTAFWRAFTSLVGIPPQKWRMSQIEF